MSNERWFAGNAIRPDLFDANMTVFDRQTLQKLKKLENFAKLSESRLKTKSVRKFFTNIKMPSGSNPSLMAPIPALWLKSQSHSK